MIQHQLEDSSDIAIVGMALRFPGASTPERYWENLCAGVESISFFTDEELRAEGVSEEFLADPNLVRAGAVLEGIDQFDAPFFGFNRREAELTDPQQRLLIECCWEALERAGHDAETFPGSIGVFAGASISTYLMHNLLSNRGLLEAIGGARTVMGNCNNFLTTWVSYKLNLRGPSFTVQTACSTSLVAVHLAWQSLLNGECDMALAGGSSVSLPQKGCYRYREGGIHSPDGHCRAFDASAAGTVSGNGAGVVVLRRLADALADGDTIHGVIKGSAVNNDGSGKIGYTAPSINGQAAVIAEALAIAGVDPETVGYVEAHGTGTPLGDPIEVGALTRAFRARTSKKGFCALGSAKTNIGHLDTAAGVAGLIKAVLAMRHGEIPPTLHFLEPNPRCELPESPFFVADRLLSWPRLDTPRRAGVSALGIGGTNVHVVLEEAPEPVASGPGRPWEILTLSAATPSALEAAAAGLADHLRANPDASLSDAAFTLQTGRKTFPHRLALACRDLEEAVRGFSGEGAPRLRRDVQETRNRPVAFLFPGQGAQRAGMGRELYRVEARFREEVDSACAILAPRLGFDLRRVLLAEGGEAEEAAAGLSDTSVAQPALFVVEHALASLWMSWGIRPQALLGHSLGEYVAACLSGVFSLEDALALVVERGRLMQRLEPGAMLAVSLAEEDLMARLGEDLSIASVNAPSRCVVSGPEPIVSAFEARLAAEGIAHRRLATAHAFHSRMTDPVLEEFARVVRRVRLRAPVLPFLSNVTGTWIRETEATDPAYWVRHLRSTVRFGAGLEELLREPERMFLEVGPGRSLAALVRQHGAAGRVVAASLGDGREPEPAVLMDALGHLWTAGFKVDWVAFRGKERRRRLSLPTYPFERESYWIEAARSEPTAPAPPEAPAAGPRPGRLDRIREALLEVVRGLVGLAPEEVDLDASFAELGVDSLLLIQFSQSVQRRMGVKLSLTQLMEEAVSLGAVAAFLDRELPPDAFSESPAPVPPVAPPGAVPFAAVPGTLERVLEQQTQLMARLMDLLERQAGTAPSASLVSAAVVAKPSPAPVSMPLQASSASDDLSPRQQRHLEALVERYTRRTPESKRRTDEQRPSLADNRASAGFRQRWKELIYPLIADRSAGSRFRDVDGNEYVDIAMGFGVNLFGHSPGFVTEAVRAQLDRGVHIGPQSDLAGGVASGIRRLTGVERVAFCNSGTEAVMGALRISRAVTGRRRTAIFAGSYHGSYDGVLVRGMTRLGHHRPLPLAPGVPASLLEDVLLLPYGEPEALQALRAEGGELAAILVEPVQSRRPDFQPREFLRELRRIADETGAALIFDEVVTGFRSHPGGVQALFDVRADLVTYGKVLGGGMPIGVIAGRAAFMNAIDGGPWRFGDDSVPVADKTFFTGTFCKHPLAMAAAGAVVRHLEESGPGLQEGLNRRAAAMRERLNTWFEAEAMPVRMVGFSSLFLFQVAPQVAHGDLFFFHLIDNGVYVWEGHTCYLSTAHSDEDVERIVRAAQASATAMREGGFFPELSGRPDGRRKPTTEQPPRILPMTPGQHQLWVLSQMGEDAALAYHETAILHLRGDLDAAALGRALQGVVDRHESLRSTFPGEGEMVRVLPRLEIAISSVDPAAWLDGEARRPFDLEHGPLLRASLARLDGRHHALLLVYHHIAVDGRSLGVLLSELRELYAAERTGVPARLPEPERLGEALPGEGERRGVSEALTWWRERLSPPPPPLELPADHPRPALFTYRGDRRTFVFEGVLTSGLRRLGAARGASLFHTVLAGFFALAHRLSDQDDVVVGVPSVGAREEGRSFVGYDLNLLPVRNRLETGATFASLLAAVRRGVAEAWDHREAPFDSMAHSLGLPPDFSRPQLASVLFNLDRAEAASRFADLELTVATVNPGGAKLEIFLNAVDQGDRLLFECDYYRDLLDGATVVRWLGHLRSLLSAAAERPDLAVSDLPLLGEAERHQILREWNDSARPATESEPLHRLIEARAVLTPSATALSADERLTLADLNARANRLARFLVRLGVGPEVPVGVCLDRSVDLLVSLLAVLKAGGAYVPLDPAWPRPRLAFMLDDALGGCATGIVLTRTSLLERLPASSARAVCLDAELHAVERESAFNLPGGATADNLAYILYTSGSTGMPKGVQVTHRSLVGFLASMAGRPGFRPGERLLAVTSLSFDIAGLELYLPLLAGGEVVLAGQDEASDGVRLLAALEEGGADVLQATPSTWQLLLEAGWQGSAGLRALCGGEALPTSLAERILARASEVWNLYGPTETTVWSAVGRVQGGRVTLGRPVADTGLFLLDPELRPVPVGVPGELYIGGAGVARGYRGRPDLTAERFVPHPFGAVGARLYRTGDLARFRPDGEIEFLGRVDHQVKVRGFRIELGEVEATLARHPAVRQAVVAVRHVAGEPNLSAWVVPQEGASTEAGELRAFVAGRLPAYMVPAAFVVLEALPLTPNGKVDRKALPDPGSGRPDQGRSFVAPRGELERQIAEVWQSVLGLDRVGVEDSFFDLGGQSLTLLRVRRRLADLGHEVTPTELFRFPTVGALAAHLGRLAVAEASEESPPGERLGEDGGYIERLKEGRGRLAQRLERTRS